MKYSTDKYTFDRFEVSKRKNKKYNAVLINNDTKNEVRVPFGDNRYQQYHDKALGHYKRLDHHDAERRRLYRLRHKKDLDPNNFTAGNFAYYYLW
jgi:hypothetical protein